MNTPKLTDFMTSIEPDENIPSKWWPKTGIQYYLKDTNGVFFNRGTPSKRHSTFLKFLL